jgi:hypothetical protein
MGMRWLDDIEGVLKEFDGWDIENIPLSDLIDDMLNTNFKVYKKQKAILTLVQAMFSVPELRELDEKHDEMMITTFARVFKRMGMTKQLKERERLGRIYLESTHAVFVTMSTQQGERVKRTQADLKVMVMALLQTHLN